MRREIKIVMIGFGHWYLWLINMVLNRKYQTFHSYLINNGWEHFDGNYYIYHGQQAEVIAPPSIMEGE